MKSKLKFGSAVQSCSGGLHVLWPFFTLDTVEDAHSGNCLLYAMFMEQSAPTPVEDTKEQVTNTMSIVPSLSVRISVQIQEVMRGDLPISAKDMDWTPEGREPVLARENPASLLFTHI